MEYSGGKKKGIYLSVPLQLHKAHIPTAFPFLFVHLEKLKWCRTFRRYSAFCWKPGCSEERCNRCLSLLVLLCGVIQTWDIFIWPLKNPFFHPKSAARLLWGCTVLWDYDKGHLLTQQSHTLLAEPWGSFLLGEQGKRNQISICQRKVILKPRFKQLIICCCEQFPHA